MSKVGLRSQQQQRKKVGASVVVPGDVPYGFPDQEIIEPQRPLLQYPRSVFVQPLGNDLIGPSHHHHHQRPPSPPPVPCPIIARTQDVGGSFTISAGQSVNGGMNVQLNINGANYSSGGVHANGNTIVFPVPGKYVITVSLTATTNSSISQVLGLSLNGNVVGAPQYIAGGNANAGVTEIIDGSAIIQVTVPGTQVSLNAANLRSGSDNIMIGNGTVSVQLIA